MKHTSIFLLLLCFFYVSPAQLTKPLTKPATPTSNFADSLNRIVLDFKNNFQTIQGRKLARETEADAYQSKAGLPGATNCKILRYHSEQDQSASWQGTMYNGDNFEDAVKAYRKTYEQIKKTKIKGIEPAGNGFVGKLEQSDENVRFAVSSLRIKTSNKTFMNFVADVELLSNYTGWAVHVNLYSKTLEKEEEEKDDILQ